MAWSKSMVPKEKQMMLDHDIPYFQITILGYCGCPSFLDPLSSDCWLSHDHKLVSLSHCCPSSSHSHLGLLWFNLYIYIFVLCIYIYSTTTILHYLMFLAQLFYLVVTTWPISSSIIQYPLERTPHYCPTGWLPWSPGYRSHACRLQQRTRIAWRGVGRGKHGKTMKNNGKIRRDRITPRNMCLF
jgi:hypothetical protein